PAAAPETLGMPVERSGAAALAASAFWLGATMSGAFRAKLMAGAAACAAALLAATPARAQDDGASALDRLIARLIDGEDTTAAEGQAMFVRVETQAEILFARAQQATQLCDERAMSTATLQLDRLVSRMESY